MSQAMPSSLTTLHVLEIIAERQPVAVAEVARTIARPKSTAQRALLTLYEGGWIRPEGSDRTRWVLTARVLTVARQVGNGGGLRDIARPALEDLRQATEESVSLATMDGFETVTTEFLEGRQSIRFVDPAGTRLPLHAGASGKTILAHLPPAEIDRFLERDLERYTRLTVTSARSLRRELAKIRTDGFAVSRGEVSLDVAGVAAAIIDGRGIAVASVAVMGPISRFTDDESVERAAAAVRKTACTISAALNDPFKEGNPR